MSLYEVQVLDSYENKTYADGQAAAVYGHWSTPPVRRVSGRLTTSFATVPALTEMVRCAGKRGSPVLHNGVLVQDNVELTGPTSGGRHPYKAHPLPLLL